MTFRSLDQAGRVVEKKTTNNFHAKRVKENNQLFPLKRVKPSHAPKLHRGRYASSQKIKGWIRINALIEILAYIHRNKLFALHKEGFYETIKISENMVLFSHGNNRLYYTQLRRNHNE